MSINMPIRPLVPDYLTLSEATKRLIEECDKAFDAMDDEEIALDDCERAIREAQAKDAQALRAAVTNRQEYPGDVHEDAARLALKVQQERLRVSAEIARLAGIRVGRAIRDELQDIIPQVHAAIMERYDKLIATIEEFQLQFRNAQQAVNSALDGLIVIQPGVAPLLTFEAYQRAEITNDLSGQMLLEVRKRKTRLGQLLDPMVEWCEHPNEHVQQKLGFKPKEPTKQSA